MAKIKIAIAILVIMFCSCNNNSKNLQVNQTKQGGELIEEAYRQGNWDLIISVGDTIIGDDDPHNISIAYAEALAAKGNYEKAINVLNRKIVQKPDDYYLYQTKGNANLEEFQLGVCRGNEIKEWLSRNEGKVSNYVIIDDFDDMLPEQEDHVVLTDTLIGITEWDAAKAIKILNS